MWSFLSFEPLAFFFNGVFERSFVACSEKTVFFHLQSFFCF